MKKLFLNKFKQITSFMFLLKKITNYILMGMLLNKSLFVYLADKLQTKLIKNS